jgi:hypothetical protein
MLWLGVAGQRQEEGEFVERPEGFQPSEEEPWQPGVLKPVAGSFRLRPVAWRPWPVRSERL